MTCIVGLVHQGEVFIGGDSAGVAGYDFTVRADKKVFTNGEFVIGFTTSFRMGQILRYAFKPPRREESKDIFEYMVTDFVDAVRQAFTAKGYLRKENEVESGGVFVVGYRGRLFIIDSDYQVAEAMANYTSVGSGSDLAKGSLFSTKNSELTPEERIEIALSAAQEHNAGVGAPFYMEKIK